jgi:hypothetical protein
VEVKAPKNYRISEIQKAQIRKLRDKGIIAIVTNEINDVEQIIDLIDERGTAAINKANKVGLYK